MQVTDGPVPRSYLPSILVLSHEIDGTMKRDDFVEESKSPIVNESDLSTQIEREHACYLMGKYDAFIEMQYRIIVNHGMILE